ncbi:MAG: hypothetical protein K2H55_05015, partial [Helicobacter sp.]|nr:hypothetical protein [Helicobacter sp.]
KARQQNFLKKVLRFQNVVSKSGTPFARSRVPPLNPLVTLAHLGSAEVGKRLEATLSKPALQSPKTKATTNE